MSASLERQQQQQQLSEERRVAVLLARCLYALRLLHILSISHITTQ
jgi:hypothetical protein